MEKTLVNIDLRNGLDLLLEGWLIGLGDMDIDPNIVRQLVPVYKVKVKYSQDKVSIFNVNLTVLDLKHMIDYERGVCLWKGC